MNIKSNNTYFATSIASIALICWASVASLVVLVGKLPIMEKQFILFFFSSLLAIIKFKSSLFTIFKQTPLKLLFSGFIGIYLNNFFFVSAFENAPAEKVDLINYLWPILIILFSAALPKEKLKINQIIGAFVAFYGVYLLITNGEGLAGFETEYWRGYLYALADAFCWVYFTLTLRKYKQSPITQIGVYCGIATIFSLIAHLTLEEFVMPTGSQVFYLALIGITSQGAAYYCWDFGIKKGDYKLLCVLSYFNPILSVGLLIYFGLAPLTLYLAVATVFVCIGAFVACEKFNGLAKKAWHLFAFKKEVVSEG